MNEIITVIGSSNTGMVVRPVRLPARGETVTGGDFGMYRGCKGANKAVAAARLEGTSTLQIKKPIVFLDEYNPGTQRKQYSPCAFAPSFSLRETLQQINYENLYEIKAPHHLNHLHFYCAAKHCPKN